MEKTMSDEHFNLIYYGFIFFIIFCMVNSTIIGLSRSNYNFSEEKLKSMKKICRKGIIMYSIIAITAPVSICAFLQ